MTTKTYGERQYICNAIFVDAIFEEVYAMGDVQK